MEREEALRLLRGGREGVAEWNRRMEAKEANEAVEDLCWADLSRAGVSGADLSGTGLRKANLSGAELRGANLVHADLTEADLRGADLLYANFTDADLSGTNLLGARIGHTTFANVDLSGSKGLETIEHVSPSTIGIDTVLRSNGKIPEAFLRGCGVPEPWIEYLPSLSGMLEPIQFYSCFISYCGKDQGFAERLYADLQARGVRCWFAPHDLKIGDRYRLRIDESIRVHDKLLLVLSEGSVVSQEVEVEVEAAMEREKSGGETVLFPVRLDDSVMKASGWPAIVRRTRHIGDFTGWKDHDSYTKALDRLLRDLKAEAAKGAG